MRKTALLPRTHNSPDDPPEPFDEAIIIMESGKKMIGYFYMGAWYRSKLPGEKTEKITAEIDGWIALVQQ